MPRHTLQLSAARSEEPPQTNEIGKWSCNMADINKLRNGLVVTAFWEARPDETDAVADILKRFMPQAQREPGVQAFVIHQSRSERSKFFFYEVFDDEQAFEAHQQTEHFKSLIAGQALPKLAKRERAQYSVL
jgi:quinol monooxygenase YgiN